MTVPIATVNKDNLPKLRKYKIRFPRKIGNVQFESISK
jgi:hypothetical protein